MDYTSFEKKITCMFYKNDFLTPYTFKVKILFQGLAASNENAYMSQVAFKKIFEWLNLNEMIVCDYKDSYEIMLFDNPIMISPMVLNETVFAALLYAKIQALSKDALNILSIELTNSENKMTYTLTSPEGLPDLSYMEGTSFFDAPWWNRNDNTMMDYDVSDATPEELLEIEAEMEHDFIKNYEKELIKEYTNQEEIDIEVIPFEKIKKWKPTEI